LVRVTFPLGALPGEAPKTLSASRLGSGEGIKRLKLTSIWAAPADATVPGRSFFSVLRAGELGVLRQRRLHLISGAIGVVLSAAAARIGVGRPVEGEGGRSTCRLWASCAGSIGPRARE